MHRGKVRGKVKMKLRLNLKILNLLSLVVSVLYPQQSKPGVDSIVVFLFVRAVLVTNQNGKGKRLGMVPVSFHTFPLPQDKERK